MTIIYAIRKQSDESFILLSNAYSHEMFKHITEKDCSFLRLRRFFVFTTLNPGFLWNGIKDHSTITWL